MVQEELTSRVTWEDAQQSHLPACYLLVEVLASSVPWILDLSLQGQASVTQRDVHQFMQAPVLFQGLGR